MEHLDWGLEMTVLGMGLVFAMLALLWLILTIVLKFDKEEVEEEASAASDDTADDDAAAEVEAAPVAVIGTPPPSGSEDIVAVIALAVAKHRAQGVPASLAAVITIAAIEHRKAVGRGGPVARSFWPGTQPIRWTAEARARARQTNNWN